MLFLAVAAMIIQQSFGAEIGQETLLVIDLTWEHKVTAPFPIKAKEATCASLLSSVEF